MHMLMKAMGESQLTDEVGCVGKQAYVRYELGIWLSMGLKCADQVLGGDEVYLVASNIGFLQKQTRPSLFAVCFSSCDLL